ncbi:MAG: hypothetical protein LRY24_01430 [Erysipelotrichaceae bacterium]|nr:hypothetical protein [Erysipelotrichaceae bacterium]MCD8574291.1 hypothetical protein [Erysipelotrichaceae bacterium]
MRLLSFLFSLAKVLAKQFGRGDNAFIFDFEKKRNVAATFYYVLNVDSIAQDAAKKFLNDLASTAAGHDYMVNKTNMVPAFNSVTLVPATPLSKAVLEHNQAKKAYAWWQNDMPSGFGMETLGPVYELFAKGEITKEQFVTQITSLIEGLK